MKNKIIIIIVALVLGFLVDHFLFVSDSFKRGGEMEMGNMKMTDSNTVNIKDIMKTEDGHTNMPMAHHTAIEVSKTIPVPAVSLETFKDVKGGYNIHVITSNYKWTPEKANEAPVQGEGHAHVYVNGTKVSRLYGEWLYIEADKFKKGENTIEVTLNANDHSEWLKNGEHITAIAKVSN